MNTKCNLKKEETQQANAELISAAPDFLAALIEARGHLEYCNYGDSYERECAKLNQLPEMIEAAIAKVIGE